MSRYSSVGPLEDDTMANLAEQLLGNPLTSYQLAPAPARPRPRRVPLVLRCRTASQDAFRACAMTEEQADRLLSSALSRDGRDNISLILVELT